MRKRNLISNITKQKTKNKQKKRAQENKYIYIRITETFRNET